MHVLGLDDNNRQDLTDRVHKIRADLVGQGWLRAVNVQDNGDDVAILAQGPWAHLFHGVVEQNLIYHVMDQATGLATRAALAAK